MAIITKLDKLMEERGETVASLAGKIGISPVNLSNIKNGNISAIRFSTLDAICREIGCQPGDMLAYEERNKKKIIPMFLDYSGTTDLLLTGGAENLKSFFNSIKSMQQKSNHEVRIMMVTGSPLESARSKYKLLSELAENYGLPNLFDGAIAEYCGYIVRKDKVEPLSTMDTRILEKRREIESIIQEYGGEISSSVTSFYNVTFDEISRVDLATVSETIEKMIQSSTGDESIETVTYYDAYGKECDIKPKSHSKSNSVYLTLQKLNEMYEIPFVITGGDSQDEDLKMYTENRERILKMGLDTVFLAPSNIGEISEYDKNIIVSDWENSDGISEAIRRLTSRLKVKEDGGLEI